MGKLKFWWQRKFLPYASSTIAYAGIQLIQKSCRIRVHGLDRYLEIAKKYPCIIVLWHQDLLLTPYLVKKLGPELDYSAVISHSRDGEVLRSLVERNIPNTEVIRASQKKGSEALRSMVGALDDGRTLVVTPDGPRGPRKIVKPGIAYAAQKAAAYIVPFTWTGNRVWALESSWDHFKIPKPGAKLDVYFGTPLAPQEDIPFSTRMIQKHMLQELEHLTHSVLI